MCRLFLSNKDLSVLWYGSHDYDKSALELAIRSYFTMSSLNATLSTF